jgi:4-hydroxy-tetrahydrodipicolinate synthase
MADRGAGPSPRIEIGRLLTAMVTPFTPDGRSVDWEAAQQLAVALCEDGSDGVVVFGTTGESPTLTDEEKIDLVRRVRAALPREKSVVAGAGTNSTQHTLHLAHQSMEAGADALLAVVPYYNKPPQDGIYQHFKAVSEVGPTIMYNIQGRTGLNMSVATTLRCAELPGILGVKEASGSMDQMSLIAAAKPDRFRMWAGDDGFTLPLLAVGGHGVICVVSHLAGSSMKRMIEAYLAGDVQAAARIHRGLAPVINALMTTASNPVPLKSALKALGFDAGPFRLPLVGMPDEDLAQVMKVIAKAGDLITLKARTTARV